MRIRVALLPSLLAVLGGCALSDLGVGASDVDPPSFPECRAESYAFAGRGTFASLGLVGQSAARLPDPDRPAMIWVTREPVAFSDGTPVRSRMLCFEFDDGSGGSEWPVNAAWQPPGADVSAEASVGIPLLLGAVLTILVVGGLAFRKR